MDILRLGSISPHRRRKWLILLSLLGVSSYGAYKVYNSPYIAAKRKRLTNLFEGIASFAELVTDSAETITLVSRDLKQFLESDSDEIPNSLKQIAKIAKSKEFTDSISRVSEAVAVGVLRGYNIDNNVEAESNPSVLFSEAGTGFVSVLVGSFAKNLVLGFYEVESSVETTSTKPRWMSLLCDDKFREVLADCIERFTSSAVTVYIEKTAGVNTYDQIFSGLTNPKHRDGARDVLVSVCNGALETFMRTSRQEEETVRDSSSFSGNGWAEVLTTTLAVPSNRKFMFDVTGRVTLETMRSILEFVVLKTSQSFMRSFVAVQEEVTDRGRQVVGYVGAKSSVIITLCLAVYLHVVNRFVRVLGNSESCQRPSPSIEEGDDTTSDDNPPSTVNTKLKSSKASLTLSTSWFFTTETQDFEGEPLYPETEYMLFVVVNDGDTGKSRGYGFVCYSSKAEMENALGSLDGLELEGWAIRVNLTQGRNPDIIHQHFGIILSFLEVMIQLN
ncbi:hypothetical protein Bca101_030186 [Brassica carinata]